MKRLGEVAALPEAGNKARTLAQMWAAGLPVPDGIVVLPGEEIDAQALGEALRHLGDRFVVRSSADVEDAAGTTAPGVFESVVGVAPDEVPAAIERVRASALAEPARAYLGSRGLPAARMAVLIQPQVAAQLLGVLHTDVWRAEERLPDEPEWGSIAPREVDPREPLGLGAVRLVVLLGGPLDIEYAWTREGPLFLQARPLSAPILVGGDWDPGDDEIWQRDAEHNPEPLSAAQASLVARVEGIGGLHQRMLNGYLFYRREKAGEGVPPHRLPNLFHDEIVPWADHLLASTDPIECYRAIFARHVGEISPSLERARTLLDEFLKKNLGEALTRHAELLAGVGEATVVRDAALWRIGRADPAARPALLGEYNCRFGALAPAWDVAVPCDDELPNRVLVMAALVARGPSPEERHAQAGLRADEKRLEILSRLDRMARGALKHLLPVVRAALAIGEADDFLFFRAQQRVRHRLLSTGPAEDPSLLFELPIGQPFDRDRALAARSQRLAQGALSPPSEIVGRRPSWRGATASDVLRGVGTRGRAWGRALVLRDPAHLPATLPEGAVLVVPAILPSLGYLIPSAAALVTDHGGALSHGATLAREYGVPAVLNTGRATELLCDGDDLLVDADGGRVYRMGTA